MIKTIKSYCSGELGLAGASMLTPSDVCDRGIRVGSTPIVGCLNPGWGSGVNCK